MSKYLKINIIKLRNVLFNNVLFFCTNCNIYLVGIGAYNA